MALVVKSFARVVSVAGTAVPLSATRLHVVAFTVRAKTANTGDVYIGDVSSANSTSGMFLSAGEANEKEALANSRGKLQEFNLNKIYLDAAVSGEGVIVEYIFEES